MNMTKDGQKKFGSKFAAQKYDSYHAGPQPGEANSNQHAEPKNLSGDMDHPTDIHVTHDHESGKHSVKATYADGHEANTEHGSAQEAHDSANKLAYEDGGEKQAEDVKKNDHPDQQGAKSEQDGFMMPDLAI